MLITEVQVKLADDTERSDRVRAYCSVVFDDCFVVRDVKLVEVAKGLLVAMPSRKVGVPCPKCGDKNPATSRYCGECGQEQDNRHFFLDGKRAYNDACHPITREFREELERAVFTAYHREVDRRAETLKFREAS